MNRSASNSMADEIAVRRGDHPERACDGLNYDDARWLQTVALPAILAAAEVPSDPPANVPGELDENGQMLGQLSIDG